jgi:hypothetical protein
MRVAAWTCVAALVLIALASCARSRTSSEPDLPAAEPSPVAEEPVAEPSIFEGAGSSLVPLAPTRVRRRIEDLTLRRRPDSWTVEAVDVFEAGPVTETVTVGLPDFEGVSDEGGRRSTLSDVSLVVDGIEVEPVLAPPPVTADLGAPGGIGRIYSWELRFSPEQLKVVRLRYRVLASRTRQGDELLFFYLNTGTPWFGESGRINLRVELEDATTRELVPSWIRPAGFGVRPRSLVWRLHEEEPESDLVLAMRPFQDPLAGFEDRSLGLLAMGPEEIEGHLDRSTPREWDFWRAFLQARRGEPVAEDAIGELLGAEAWYRATLPGQRPRAMTAEEEALFEMLTQRLTEWEAMQLPSPQDLRSTAP